MKKALILVLIFMGSVYTMNAQFSQLHIAGVFPTGDFGDDNSKKEIYQGVGHAATGLNIGYKYYNPLSVENLSFVFGIDLFYNPLQGDYKDDYEDVAEDITFPVYLNVPATVGLNYAYPVAEKVKIYGEVGLGCNYSQGTNFKYEYRGYDYELKFDPSFKFAYGIEGGIFVNEKFSIGLRYNNLGSHKYKYKINSEKTKFDKALSISNLSLALGLLL